MIKKIISISLARSIDSNLQHSVSVVVANLDKLGWHF